MSNEPAGDENGDKAGVSDLNETDDDDAEGVVLATPSSEGQPPRDLSADDHEVESVQDHDEEEPEEQLHPENFVYRSTEKIVQGPGVAISPRVCADSR